MSTAILTNPPLPSAIPAPWEKAGRLPSSLPRDGWAAPLLIALGLHFALVAGGLLSRHDTLLDLIAQGEVQAVAPVDQKPLEQEVELDFTPPPPPEPNPDFIKPEEVRPKLVQEEPPKPKPVEAPKPQAAPQMNFAPSGVVIGDKNFPKPPYPYDAKAKRFQGTVLVTLDIVDGIIVSAEVASSSGYGILDSSAAQWIRQKWHFPPGTTRVLTQPVKFELAS